MVKSIKVKAVIPCIAELRMNECSFPCAKCQKALEMPYVYIYIEKKDILFDNVNRFYHIECAETEFGKEVTDELLVEFVASGGAEK